MQPLADCPDEEIVAEMPVSAISLGGIPLTDGGKRPAAKAKEGPRKARRTSLPSTVATLSIASDSV
eukprot:10998306-Lingulodinium_polyedra.AAC.1